MKKNRIEKNTIAILKGVSTPINESLLITGYNICNNASFVFFQKSGEKRISESQIIQVTVGHCCRLYEKHETECNNAAILNNRPFATVGHVTDNL